MGKKKEKEIKLDELTPQEKLKYEIAEELGLAHNGDGVYSARQIEEMTDAELTRMLPSIRAVARSTPATKLRVVKALKAAGEVVALTGDGINDAPAITAADVGIAMGSGTEVSKQAADIVLLDDSFKTIVGAVQWGRGIYENFQRFILFQLSVNVAAVAVVILCTLFDLATPFNALMLLWINLIPDPVCCKYITIITGIPVESLLYILHIWKLCLFKLIIDLDQ